MTSAEHLAGAASALALDDALQLTLVSGFLTTGDADKAAKAATLLAELTTVTGVPRRTLIDALVAIIDRSQPAEFAGYLTAVVTAYSANQASSPAAQPAGPNATLKLTEDERARVLQLLDNSAPIDGLAVGTLLFHRQVEVDDLSVVFDVINAHNGGAIDLYVKRGRAQLLATYPPTKLLTAEYRLQVEAKVFVVRVD